LSGALYVPFELRHLIHQPTVATALVIAANVVVVGFLAWQIWGRRRASVQWQRVPCEFSEQPLPSK